MTGSREKEQEVGPGYVLQSWSLSKMLFTARFHLLKVPQTAPATGNQVFKYGNLIQSPVELCTLYPEEAEQIILEHDITQSFCYLVYSR